MDVNLPTYNQLRAKVTFGTPEQREMAQTLLDTGLYRVPTDEEARTSDHPYMILLNEMSNMTPEQYREWQEKDASYSLVQA